MNISNPDQYRGSAPNRMPPPEIPKQKTNWFTWLFIGFALLVLIGIVGSFVSMADEPRPVLEVPADEQPTPASPPGQAPTPPAP